MGIFDKLKAIASSQASPAPSAMDANQVAPAASTVPEVPQSATQVQVPTRQVAEVTNTNTIDNDGDNTWDEVVHSAKNVSSSNLTTPSKSKDLTFTENRLHRVDPADLVWAPFYRYNQLFPARRCRPEELVFDPSLQAVSSEDEVVVEFFSQVKMPNTCQRDTVLVEKVLPYWAYSANDDEETADKTCWNSKRVESVRKALFKGKSLSAKNVNLVLDTAMSTAKRFLDLALTNFIPEGDEESEEEAGKGLDTNAPMVLNDSRCDEDENEQTEKDITAFAYREKLDDDDEPVMALTDRTLRVGDSIRYHNMVFGKTIRTTIVGFSDDRNHPLLLEDNYMIDMNTFIGKVTSTDPVAVPATISNKRPREEEPTEKETATSKKRQKTAKGAVTAKNETNDKQRSIESQQQHIPQEETTSTVTTTPRLFPLHKFVLFREDETSKST